MPEKVLHEGCTLKCSACQAVMKVPAPVNQVYRIGDNRVLLSADQFRITQPNQCLGPTNGLAPCPPCMGPMPLRWRRASNVATINGKKVLLQSSVGTFVNYNGANTTVAITDSSSPTPASTT